jgi:hypothetical protein
MRYKYWRVAGWQGELRDAASPRYRLYNNIGDQAEAKARAAQPEFRTTFYFLSQSPSASFLPDKIAPATCCRDFPMMREGCAGLLSNLLNANKAIERLLTSPLQE